jgi:hypothetical protein
MSERKMNCEDCGFTLCRCELPEPPECECPAVAGCSNAYSGFDAMSVDGDPMSVRALKQAYRKHVKLDESIGWDELSDALGNALAQIMGDEEFCQWLQSI